MSCCARSPPSSTSSRPDCRRSRALPPAKRRPKRRRSSASSKACKQERERLGAVNLRAEDELAEVEASRDRLIAERDDLTEAIKRLRQAIHSLNQEGRERLLAAFDVVNAISASCSRRCSRAARPSCN